MKLLVSPARYTTMDCNSSGFPSLPIGAISFHFAINGFSASELSVRSVPIYPGLMQFTRTPVFAHSTASDLVSIMTPALDALYAHCGCGTFTICPDIDAVLMIEPYPCFSITLPAAVAQRKTPVRLMSMTFFHCSNDISSAGTFRQIPALLKHASNLPYVSATFATMASTSSFFVTSH